MRVSGRGLPAVAIVMTLVLAGCGGAGDSQTQDAEASPTATASPSTPSPATASEVSGSQQAPARTQDDTVEIEVEIEDGSVTPSGQRVDVEVGQTIRMVVSSDVADEIHVHATPDRTFAFKSGARNRQFEFALQQPGVVEAELHELGDVVVTIAARP